MIRQLRWRELLEFHPGRWRDLAPGRAGRVALGIAVPLLIGALTGHVQDGIFAALGALPAGLVSFQGVNRSRMQAVLVASLGIAVSTFVGATLPETRTGSPLEALPPLRPLQRALEEQGTIDPSVLVVTDALVDAVATVGALLPHGVSPAANVSLTELRGRTPWG